MQCGIVSHPYHLDESNIEALAGFDFVFLCVDRGKARAILCRYLQSQGIPFVDAGLNLHLVSATLALVGTCRYTLCTATQSDHLAQYVPVEEDEEDVVYRQNIQVADMNALNAQLAVMKWKQHCGFYQDDFRAHNATFSVNSMSLSRDVLVAATKP
jgi:molybdopterin/thiamine biosynthesis adenylyltransferase